MPPRHAVTKNTLVTDRRSGHKWFAAAYERMTGPAERPFMKPVREEIAGGARGRVLELGAGTGLNFEYYTAEATEVVATEPDPYMLDRARERAEQSGRAILLHQAPAERLPFADGSFDTVVSTLVLCSVREPSQALAEVRRVLKPAGEFRFYEHVRYEHAFGAFWQDLIAPIWGWFGAGCHPNRDTAATIRQAGFELEKLERTKPVPPLPPMVFIRPHIKGVARLA